MYSDLYIRGRPPKITSLVMSFMLIALVGSGLFYVLKNGNATQATNGISIGQQVVNVSTKDTGFYWVSDKEETGWVLVGTDPNVLNMLAIDDRDTAKVKNKFKEHVATIRNLKPATKYYYKVVSGNTIYTNQDGSPYFFVTPKSQAQSGFSKPIYGKIVKKSGEPAENVVIKVLIKDAVPLVATSKSTGEWLVTLQSVYSADLTSTIQVSDETDITVEMDTNDGMQSRVYSLASKSSPLPQTIVLGNNYDFRKDEQVLPAFSSNADVTGGDVSILYPKKDAAIPGNKPLIKGKGIPNTRIQLELNSKPAYKFSILIDERGEWTASIPKPLLAGKYTLTLYGKNSSEEDVVLLRNFSILPSGENVLGEATASASITPTQEATPTEALPTAQPSPSGVPTAAPSLEPTVASASPTIVLSPSPLPPTIVVTTVPLIQAGGNGLLYTAISVGLLITGGAVMLLL